MNRLAAIIGIIFLIQVHSFAQTDTSAEQYYELAKDLYSIDINDGRIPTWLAKSYSLASNDSFSPPLFLAELTSFCGNYLFHFEVYKMAALYYNEAIDYYRLSGGQIDNIAILHQNVALCYQQIRFKNETVGIAEAKNYSPELFQFHITQNIERRGDTVYAQILGGTTDGLFAESAGTVFSSNIKIHPTIDRSGKALGEATMYSLDSSLSWIKIVLLSPNDSLYDVYPGDRVSLISRLPVHDYTSIFWKLSSLDARLINNQNGPLWDFWQLLPDDSEVLEQELLHAMLKDVWEIAELFKDNRSIPALFQVIEKGRYQGRTIINVLQNASYDDMKIFLLFVLNYSESYSGMEYRLSETFATWVMNNAPTSRDEFVDRVKKVKSEEDLEKIYAEFSDGILKGDYLNHLRIACLQSKSFEEANFLDEQLMKFSDMTDSLYYIGWAWFNRGNIHDEWGFDSVAIIYFGKGLDVLEKTNDLEGMAFCANNIGKVYKELEKHSTALQYINLSLSYKQALIELNGETSEMMVSIGRSFIGLGEIHQYIANYDSALFNYEKARYYMDRSNSLEGKKTVALLLNFIAGVQEELGNYDAAVALYTDQIASYRSLGNIAKVASVTDDLANAYFSLGQYRTAYGLFLDAALIKLDLKKYSSVGFSLSNCGQAMWNLGNLDSAIILHEMAVDYRAKDNDSIGMAYSYSKVAALYVETGEINLSFDFYNKATGIYLRDGDSVRVAKVLYEVGDAYFKLQDYNNALRSYLDALPIFERREMKSWIGDCYASIGSAYYNQKNYALSREYHERALAIRRESNSKKGVMYSLTDLALIVQFVDYDNDKAQLMLQEAFALAIEMNGSSYISNSYEKLGDALSNRGELTESEKYYNLAWNIYKETQYIAGQCRVMNSLGGILIQKGQFENGRVMFQESYDLAMATGLTINAANSLISLGEYYYLISDYKNAFRVAYEALDFYIQNDNPWGIGSSYILIGNTHNYMGNPKETMIAYETADSIFQSVDGQLSHATAINNMGTILFFQGNYSDALNKFYEAERILESANYKGDLSITTKWNIGEVYYEENMLNESRTWLEEAYRLATESKTRGSCTELKLT